MVKRKGGGGGLEEGTDRRRNTLASIPWGILNFYPCNCRVVTGTGRPMVGPLI
jgi:hypothetical protein